MKVDPGSVPRVSVPALLQNGDLTLSGGTPSLSSAFPSSLCVCVLSQEMTCDVCC